MANGGLYLLDKPEGITSNGLLNETKRRLGLKKAGHAGTLDPMATGLMVVATQRFTRLLAEFIGSDKRYVGAFVLGHETDTLDAEGKVTSVSEAKVDPAQVITVANEFIGAIRQTPPRVSALKVEGVRAYKLAREGKDFELAGRDVVINSLELDYDPAEDTFRFDVSCGSGTYIRSLVRDIAYRVGSLGTLVELRRMQIGEFNISRASLTSTLVVEDRLSVKEVFAGRTLLVVDPLSATALLQGKSVALSTPLSVENGRRLVVFRERAELFSDLVGFVSLKDGDLIPESMFVETLE